MATSQLNLNIDSDALGLMIGGAVMDQITPEQRDLLIKTAITHLLNPEPSYSGNAGTASPLQKAFNRAVEQFATKYATEQLADHQEFQKQVRQMFEEAAQRVFVNDREKIVGKIADAMASAFGPRY